MIVIFGLGPEKSEIKLDTIEKHCTNCNNRRNWIKAKNTLWFSLFFIPVFPVKISYTHHCPICNNGYKLSRKDWESA